MSEKEKIIIDEKSDEVKSFYAKLAKNLELQKKISRATIKLDAELQMFNNDESRLKAFLISKAYKLVIRMTEIVSAAIPAISAFYALFAAIVS